MTMDRALFIDKKMPHSLGHPRRDGEALSIGSADPMAEQLKNSIRDDRKYRSEKVQ